LGGAVSFAELDSQRPVQRSNLAIEGLPYVKAATMQLKLALFSNRPF
jgi:hypothetical protein